MATVTTTPYGTYTHGVPQYHERSYSRTDLWNGYLLQQPQRVACTDGRDDSSIFRGPYAAQCACYWLGHGHTEAYHARALVAQTLEATLHPQNADPRAECWELDLDPDVVGDEA